MGLMGWGVVLTWGCSGELVLAVAAPVFIEVGKYAFCDFIEVWFGAVNDFWC